MANLKSFFRRKRRKKAELIKLDTNITTALVPTTENIKRIEVFDTKMIDPLGITLELLDDEEEIK
ncbi:MAG: hypothetical protein ABGX00_00810 [Allomuricauda sp.]|uniref:hypothetical protein n=1 Tax=Sinomicrobium oceani TaxID=1150368 RepID=UPI00227A36BD|nr:hypothetical protein [Sinomicrobium oceani]|tara:strand:+ start:1188 stop:1382 length:195 start_codon:yes stop_codon:yes gene_type:complete